METGERARKITVELSATERELAIQFISLGAVWQGQELSD